MDKTPNVAGIILAAGESSRMGRDKALLPLKVSPGQAGQQTFLLRLIDLLRGEVSPLIVVLGHHAAEIEAQISKGEEGNREQGIGNRKEGLEHRGKEAVCDSVPYSLLPIPSFVVLRNPQYHLGQLSSLKVGLKYLENVPANGVLVSLVDHPAITKAVVRMLLDRFAMTHAPILIPTYRGRRGHPVLFSRTLLPELLDAPLEQGARFVVLRHASEVELVETDEEGIVLDIDYPADYQALMARWVKGSGEWRNKKPEARSQKSE